MTAHRSIALCAVVSLSLSAVTPALAEDVTSHVEDLGNPFMTSRTSSAYRYARNVWDMAVWDGRLYFGHGNSSNNSPAANAGPIPVVSYTPGSGFVEEALPADEQIDQFRVTNGMLTIPSHDPTTSDRNRAGFYRLEESGWTEHRLSHNNGGYHTYDAWQVGDEIYLAFGPFGGTGNTGSKAVIASNLHGTSTRWASTHTDGRIYSFLPVGDELFATGRAYISKPGGVYGDYTGILQLNPANDTFEDRGISRKTFAAGEKYVFWDSAERAVQLGEQTVYVLGDNVNDHQWDSLGLFAATEAPPGTVGPVESRRIITGQSLAWDTLLVDDEVWVLGAEELADGYRVTVHASSGDLTVWTELLNFEADTFARSFEYYDGDLYFGLGTDTDELSAASGDVLRLDAQYIPEPATLSLLALAGPLLVRRKKR